MSDALKPGDPVAVAFVGEYVKYDHDKGHHNIKGHFLDGTALGHHPWTIAVHWSADLHHPIRPTGHAMSDEKWVTLTPEQVEALEQGVIVRAHRGADTMVQGPLEGLVGEYGPDVWVGELRVKSPERIEVRESDVRYLPEPQRLATVGADDLSDLLSAWMRQEPTEVSQVSVDRIKAALAADADRALTVEEKAEMLEGINRIRAALRGETS